MPQRWTSPLKNVGSLLIHVMMILSDFWSHTEGNFEPCDNANDGGKHKPIVDEEHHTPVLILLPLLCH